MSPYTILYSSFSFYVYVYAYIGTPTVEIVDQSYNPADLTYSLTLRQFVPTTPGPGQQRYVCIHT